MHRVLKPGGRVLILEFSTVKSELLKPLYDFHPSRYCRGSAHSSRRCGQLPVPGRIHRKHPDQATLKAMMEAAGFANIDVRNLSAGIVAIHRGYKV